MDTSPPTPERPQGGASAGRKRGARSALKGSNATQHPTRRPHRQPKRGRVPFQDQPKGRRPPSEEARARAAAARQAVHLDPIAYPADLPVSERRDEIAAAIRDHQVVIVSGETGSGKTTQLPKIALELGRGRAGQIGHTQPRRIAARSTAERVAEELGTTLGDVVGYQVRFTETSSANTLVKVMTDGILLAQIQRDPQLLAYDTLIIDEAHERSLNIDFILGYLTNLLPRRPDLKVIITSATIDSQRFAEHFGGPAGPAPVIEVTGRTYPVEVRYRSLTEGVSGRGTTTAIDQPTGILLACEELLATGAGDILVFCSGEREIRDAAGALGDGLTRRDVEILPLYARLSAAEQHRIFTPHPGTRIVLATNVAETSLTVPGIRYVVDTGTARISRYSKATKIQRLPIEPISQASAQQRAGRCGRLGPGVCIRLYSREDFESRPEFTEPEILRTSLASVILQMIAVGVARTPADVVAFPFVDPPDPRGVRDGVNLLVELGALEPAGRRDTGKPERLRLPGDVGSPVAPDAPDKPGAHSKPVEPEIPGRPDGSIDDPTRLTRIGRQLAALPIDPRLARMMVAGCAAGAGREVIILTAALSIQDVRERPTEVREQADASHARYADPASDFATYLNLWEYLRRERKARSSSAFRRLCRAEFLNYLRLREWQDLVTQLRQVGKDLGLDIASSALISRPDPGMEMTGSETASTAKPPPGVRGEKSAQLDAATRQLLAARAGRAEPEQSPLRCSWDLERLHRALVPGLLSNIGMQITTEVGSRSAQGSGRDRGGRDRRQARNEYLGARGTRFAIFPASPLAKRPPAWVMAAELVETGRLWARDVAAITPEWVEAAAAHLVKHSYSEPYWSTKLGVAMCREKVLLYGLPIVNDRPMPLRRLDPALAREMFIRHALVGGEWRTHHRFYADNLAALDAAAELEHRSRRHGLVADDETLVTFYDERLPAEVTSARHFDAWWKQARRATPELLTFTPDLLLADGVGLDEAEFPSTWVQGDMAFDLTYHFEPGADDDGITCHIPLEVLARVDDTGFEWLVPGLAQELVTGLIRALPKPVRTQLVPAPDAARQLVPALATARADGVDLTAALTAAVREVRGVWVEQDAWDSSRLPRHLRMGFAIDDGGTTIATGTSLTALKRELLPEPELAAASATAAAKPRARVDAKPGGHTAAALAWDLAQGPWDSWQRDLPEVVEQRGASGLDMIGYPALVDDGTQAVATVLLSASAQAASHPRGVARLLWRTLALPPARLTSRLTTAERLPLATSAYPSVDALVGDAQFAVLLNLTVPGVGGCGQVRDAAAFEALRTAGRDQLEDRVYDVLRQVSALLATARELAAVIAGHTSLTALTSVADERAHLATLLGPGWISRAGVARLGDMARYLAAARHRLDRLGVQAARDQQLMWEYSQASDAYQAALAALPPGEAASPGLREVAWMLEELRVSLFAQQLGTAYPVSSARIRKAIAAAS